MAKKNEGTEVVEKVVMRPLADLVRNPKNPRKSDPQGLKDLCESIKRNPAYFNARPILLSDRTGELVIIAGERRSEAAAILEMTLVPTILMHGLTEEQEDEIMVRDNTHNGLWDRKKLDIWGRHLLKSWGLKPEDMRIPSKVVDDFKRDFEQYNDNNCDYPIVPMFDEDAEIFVILSRSEIDSNWLREKFNMNRMRSYKENKEYKVNVITIEDLKKCL